MFTAPNIAAVADRSRIKRTLVVKKILIHPSSRITINTDGEGEIETGKYRMGRGHWVTDIYIYTTIAAAFYLTLNLNLHGC